MSHRSALSLAVLIAASVIACSNQHSTASEKATPGEGAAAAQLGDGKVFSIIANEDGFSPSRVELQVGTKATLRFRRTTDSTCATAVVFPELKIQKPLPLGQDVDIAVPLDSARTLTFQCGMGMYKSQVVIN